MVTIKLI